MQHKVVQPEEVEAFVTSRRKATFHIIHIIFFEMKVSILIVVFSVVLMRKVDSYGIGVGRQPAHGYFEQDSPRVFEDPSLDPNLGNFLHHQPYVGKESIFDNQYNEFDAELPDDREDDRNNVFPNDFGHHFHHNPDFHRDHTPCFPWGDRRRKSKPSVPPTVHPTVPRVTTDPKVTSTSEIPSIDIRSGGNAENGENIVFPE